MPLFSIAVSPSDEEFVVFLMIDGAWWDVNISWVEHPCVWFLVDCLDELACSICWYVVVGVRKPTMPFWWNSISIVTNQR